MKVPARSVPGLKTIILLSVALSACGKQNSEPTAKGQVVAQVGDQVVTTQELENEIRLANVPPNKQTDPETLRKVLGDLVLRKFLLKQAMAAKLDREPNVLLDILRSREQVLATASLTRAVAARPPGRADVETYIADNPYKFHKREYYNVDQIVFPISAAVQVSEEVGQFPTSLDEINKKLASASILHVRQTASLLSSEFPPDLARAFDARKPNEVYFLRAGPNGIYFRILSSETRPLTGEAASDLARLALRADALKAETGVAQFSANLETKFQGDYGALMRQPESRAVKN